MNKDILKIVNKVLSEEITDRIKRAKTKIFESDKGESCECGGKIQEGECMECGKSYMDEGFDSEEIRGFRSNKDYTNKEFKRIPKHTKINIDNVDRDDSITPKKYMDNKFKDIDDIMKRHFGDEDMGDDDDLELYEDLGGMDDGHPRFGDKRLPKTMSPEEIERLLRGDDEFDRIKTRHSSKHDKDDKRERIRRGGEMEEGKKLSKGQEYIAKQAKPFDKIDADDFKKLRSDKKKSKVEESLVYVLTLNEGSTYSFKEDEVIEIIENIVKEEKSKKTKVNNVTKSSQERSKKENDEYINSVVKKMKDYLKDGSKGDFEMEPKHFPKGNGELAKMDKKAYKASDAVEEYIDNFTAAGLENLDYDGINPNEEWVDELVTGSSRAGNNPEWANAVETDVNKKRNKIRKDNLLAQVKKQAYNKAPQPVNDVAGEDTDKASKIMMKLESVDNKEVINEIQKMKSLIGYNQKTQ